MNQALISFKKVHFLRGLRPIFDNLSLSIAPHKITAIMGPSGTGKTTVLRLIGGELIPDRGEVIVDGENISVLSRRKLYKARRKMGILFQNGALFTDLNVFDNVAFPLREHTNLSEDMIRDLVLMKLQAVGLRGAIHLKTSELSGGMARRVAIARAIALDPQIMMYDEPFTGQDPIGRGILLKLIKQINNAFGMTSILVSHDIREVNEIADYAFLLAGGKVIGQGTPEQLMADQNPEVYQFVRGLPDGAVPFHYPARSYQEDLQL